MAHRIGPTPQISQPTSNRVEDVQALSRAFFIDSTDLRSRLRDMVPKDGSERMDAPFPLRVYATVGLPAAADWEGSIVFDTTTNSLKFSDGAAWHEVVDNVNFNTYLTGGIETSPYHFGVAFKAVKNANQTGIADNVVTTISFQTEVYDVGGYFASNAWTPPAGVIMVNAALNVAATVAAGTFGNLAIAKNGVTAALSLELFGPLGNCFPDITYTDIANGTDAYTVTLQVDTTVGTTTVADAAASTFFQGVWLGPA